MVFGDERKWRNWQTHSLEVAAPARAWGFKSPLPHHIKFVRTGHIGTVSRVAQLILEGRPRLSPECSNFNANVVVSESVLRKSA